VTQRPETGPVQYKGADLEAERGPGFGCFRFQLILLVVLIVLTPVSVFANWAPEVSAALLFLTILLLLFAGQTIIFLLRLVAAERRGRRRPLASSTPTVGELEDARAIDEARTLEAAGESGPADVTEVEDASVPAVESAPSSDPTVPSDESDPHA
jgi:hypothetical protein